MIDKYVLLLNNLKLITDLYYETNILQSENENYSKKEILTKFKAILKHPELKSENNALSFSAKIFYYLIYSNYYFASGNKLKELNCLQKLKDILILSKTYQTENPLDFVSIINRLLSIKKHFKTNSFFSDINMLKNFPATVQFQKEVVAERVFVHTNTHEIEYYLINNEFGNALNKIKEIEKDISKLNLKIEPYHLIYFFYLHAITLVYFGEFHRSLKYINRIMNDFDSSARLQVFIRVEILNVIVHYELKNFELANTLCNQILKKNKDAKLLISMEELIIEYILKITSMKHLNVKLETSTLKELSIAIESEKRNNKFQETRLIENYDKWLRAKTKKMFVFEIFK
ncbi:MAG: hypothetical protein NTX97_06140, partial [Bacteroidetes bacterium]|nr:hypothetical protein [Bacteroidota bacterium]